MNMHGCVYVQGIVLRELFIERVCVCACVCVFVVASVIVRDCVHDCVGFPLFDHCSIEADSFLTFQSFLVQKYPRVFIGSELLDWITCAGVCEERPDALAFASALFELKFFEHW